ncbi:MAG: 2-oxo acid dehydrogenase subunit E2 [Buchnera aphidicola (Pentalonia nigronervosa)]|uniref:Dihydrolipoamide acetyltransferase component of pyruvate dehydrogenase complex n=1 Tax=Buchnera aphidicola (Pentalonia nigronervosa) TaxID=1309793 RepID=A0A7H1B027_9GAMM|nr:MAG: 2-oxo acid dehydrogenase subunit E2 [Buchnera aphidicola (Pentalonia nigronervosa)]
MPDIGVDTVEVVEVLVKVNEKIKVEQGIVVVEGDKSSIEIPSPKEGIVKNIYVSIGDKVNSFDVIMTIELSEIKIMDESKKNIDLMQNNVQIFDKNNRSVIEGNRNRENIVYATPVVRRLARLLNVNLHQVIGTGRKRRILKQDVELYKNNVEINDLKSVKKTNFDSLNNSNKHEIELNLNQKLIGNNLHKNWMNIPHVTHFDEVDITVLEQFRKSYNNSHQNPDHKNGNITILIFILKVISHALKKFPIFNSSLSKDNKRIIFNQYTNIGVAMDINGSLIVPVLKNVNKKSIKQLSSELISISKKARENKLEFLDYQNGCFTVSNLGGIGNGWFSPIINAPEVAILGVARSQIKPFWNGECFVPVLMLPLSLSYDHRVINGADAMRFIMFIKKLLSDMSFLMM